MAMTEETVGLTRLESRIKEFSRCMDAIRSSNMPEDIKAQIVQAMNSGSQQESRSVIRGHLEREGFYDNTNAYGISDSDDIVLEFKVTDPAIAKGNDCTFCGKAKFHSREPLCYKVVDSAPAIIRYAVKVETISCTACNTIVHADVPHQLEKEVLIGRCTPRAAAAIALKRYEHGVPNSRQERMAEVESTHLPRTTQHDILAEGAERLRPVKDLLVKESANAAMRVIDDRGFPIIEERVAIKEEVEAARAVGKGKKDVRNGIHSTAVMSITLEGKTIILFDTGREHQGNVEWNLMKIRTNPSPIIVISDLCSSAKKIEPMPEKNEFGYTPVAGKSSSKKAASSSENPEKPVDKIIRGGCWAHVMLHLLEATDAPQDKRSLLINLVQGVFIEDSKTKKLTAPERLDFHNEHTLPLVNAFFEAVASFLNDPSAEPNSAWGTALNYFKNNEEHLRVFLHHAGALIHTNNVEALHLVQVRHQNNSQHYQTIIGAQIGDSYQSLIRTAIVNSENPFDYLAACLENHEDLARNPEKWTPWAYRATLQELLEARRTRVKYRIAPKRTHRRKYGLSNAKNSATEPAQSTVEKEKDSEE